MKVSVVHIWLLLVLLHQGNRNLASGKTDNTPPVTCVYTSFVIYHRGKKLTEDKKKCCIIFIYNQIGNTLH